MPNWPMASRRPTNGLIYVAPHLAASNACNGENVTVTFSPLQALLAAKCGATYISPFVGRLDAIGQFGMECVRQIRTIYDNYDFKTQILTAAVRHRTHVLEAALAGSDVVTMAFDVLELLYQHPLTDIGIDIFLKDWAKVPKP